jgi:hypothetical protein
MVEKFKVDKRKHAPWNAPAAVFFPGYKCTRENLFILGHDGNHIILFNIVARFF